MNNNGTSVYKKVYDELVEQDISKIRPFELYYLIQNMKVNTEEIKEEIREVLMEYGLTENQIDRVSRNLCYKLRFTLADAKHIEKHMKKEGLITRKRNTITIN